MVTCVVRSWHVSFKQPTNLGLHDIWWAKWGLQEPRRPRCARQIFWCFSANLICWAYDSMAKISNSQAVEASPKATTSGNPRYLPVFSFFLAHVSFFFKVQKTWHMVSSRKDVRFTKIQVVIWCSQGHEARSNPKPSHQFQRPSQQHRLEDPGQPFGNSQRTMFERYKVWGV